MPVLSWIISAPTVRFFALVCWFSLCSFSAIPPQKQAAIPPVEQQSNKHRQKRLQKKHYRLSKRWSNSKNQQQRLRIQHKIKQVEQQQNDQAPSPIVGVLGFGLSLVAIVSLFGALFLQLPGILVLSFILAVAALVVSILSLTLQGKYPDRYILRGFGITGIIISSILLVPLFFHFLFIVAI
jgi:Flp pilus assembly protein TadB